MTGKLLLFATFVLCMLLMSVNYRKKRKKIVFFGDSITEQGARPDGYIKRILQILRTETIEDKYELTGAGMSGNTVIDLHNRLDKDVLANGADIVVIYIGINDIWNKVDWIKKGTDPHAFEDVYRQIIDKLLAASVKVVACTLSVIGEKANGLNEQDEDLNAYSEIIRTLAEEYQLPLIDLRKAFTKYIDLYNIGNEEQGILTMDTVHLNSKGNELVANEMWNVLQQVR